MAENYEPGGYKFPGSSAQISLPSTTARDYNLVANKTHNQVITPSVNCTTSGNYTLCTTAERYHCLWKGEKLHLGGLTVTGKDKRFSSLFFELQLLGSLNMTSDNSKGCSPFRFVIMSLIPILLSAIISLLSANKFSTILLCGAASGIWIVVITNVIIKDRRF